MTKRALEQQLYELLQDLQEAKRHVLRAHLDHMDTREELEERWIEDECVEIAQMAAIHGREPLCMVEAMAIEDIARAELDAVLARWSESGRANRRSRA